MGNSGRGIMRSTKAVTSCPHKGDRDPRPNVRTSFRVRSVPFLGEKRGYPLDGSAGFHCDHVITGKHQWREMTPPVSACCGVGFLLILFVLCQDLVRVLVTPRLAIGVRDSNAKDRRLPIFQNPWTPMSPRRSLSIGLSSAPFVFRESRPVWM